VTPRVSVLVPCRDLGAFLPEAIASVRAQTFGGWELVVVDDGSSEPGTLAALAAAERDGARLIRLEGRGLAAARNAALAAARGDLICALDADDRLLPQYLERAVAVLDGDPGLTFASPWLRAFGDEEWEWRPERCDLPALLAECTVCTAAVARREAVVAAGGWDAAMPEPGWEDWDLWLTLLERGGRGTILPGVLFEYRRRAGSMSERCERPPARERLMQYLLAKHAASFDAHFWEVLREKDAALAGLLAGNDAAQLALALDEEPMFVLRRQELTRLEGRLAGPGTVPAEVAQRLAAELAAQKAAWEEARDEVAALRASWSWRLTAPLRQAWDLVSRGAGRRRRRE
jgi:glycosyltransferase involved in cell wall biosynthesis